MNFDNVYTEVWPTDPITGEPIFSMIIQANQDMEASIIDNVYGEQEMWSAIAQDPELNRPTGG